MVVVRSDIVPGGVLPDYELMDHHGKTYASGVAARRSQYWCCPAAASSKRKEATRDLTHARWWWSAVW
jgi:hypothetical protein